MEEFKNNMGLGREDRENQLEQSHREILEKIEQSDLPSWAQDMYMHPGINPEDYKDVHEAVENARYKSYWKIWVATGLILGLITILGWLVTKYIW